MRSRRPWRVIILLLPLRIRLSARQYVHQEVIVSWVLRSADLWLGVSCNPIRIFYRIILHRVMNISFMVDLVFTFGSRFRTRVPEPVSFVKLAGLVRCVTCDS